MKKLIATTFFTLFIVQGAGQILDGTGQIVGGTVKALLPNQSSAVSSSRAVSWAQHQADYEEGNDPSGMAASG